MTTDEVIKEEIDGILADIIKVYESSGRKASGQFEEGLSAEYEPNKGTVLGYVYLAGRGPTKKEGKEGEPTLAEAIEQWLEDKGIKPLEEDMKLSSLAYIIARKIHEEGTDSDKWLKIYEEVITAERINSIIERVSQLNVNLLITEIRATLQVLAKNV